MIDQTATYASKRPSAAIPAGSAESVAEISAPAVDRWLDPKQSDLPAMYAILDDRERPYYEHRLAA